MPGYLWSVSCGFLRHLYYFKWLLCEAPGPPYFQINKSVQKHVLWNFERTETLTIADEREIRLLPWKFIGFLFFFCVCESTMYLPPGFSMFTINSEHFTSAMSLITGKFKFPFKLHYWMFQKHLLWTGGMTQDVESLPTMHKALGSVPNAE